MQRKFRLASSTDFQRVRRLGKSYAHPLIVLLTLPNQREQSRFGVVAARTLGKAVHRNRAKRLLRAALQSLLPFISPGWDVIVIARRMMVGATFAQTQEVLKVLLQRAGLVLDRDDRAFSTSTESDS